MLAQGSDPLEPPLACGPCDFVAGALAVLHELGQFGAQVSDLSDRFDGVV